jgi:hypothetical protein
MMRPAKPRFRRGTETFCGWGPSSPRGPEHTQRLFTVETYSKINDASWHCATMCQWRSYVLERRGTLLDRVDKHIGGRDKRLRRAVKRSRSLSTQSGFESCWSSSTFLGYLVLSREG